MTVVFPGGRDIFLGKVGKQGQNKGMSDVVDAKGRFSIFFFSDSHPVFRTWKRQKGRMVTPDCIRVVVQQLEWIER